MTAALPAVDSPVMWELWRTPVVMARMGLGKTTIMNEMHPADRQAIDLMLAHKPAGAVEAAYNRARHVARRRELAQPWADLLLEDARPAVDLLDQPRR